MAWPNDSPGNSAAVLAKLFSQGGGGGDQLQLRSLQEDRLGELEDQIAAESSSPDILTSDRTGKVQATHDPVSAASILRRGLFKKSLESDLANDPSMGTAAHDEVARAETQNEEAATYNDPMQAKMRQDALNAKLAPDVIKANQARDVATINAQGRIGAVAARGNATGMDSGGAQYWAQQALRDRSVLTQVPAALRPQVMQLMSASGQDPVSLTNQTKQMSESANDLLPIIDQVQQHAAQLHASGAFDLVDSPLRQFFVKHGAGTLMGYRGDGTQLANDAGHFQTELGLLQSGVARAHAGARGAGNSDMAARFERLMNAGGDLPTFLGELQGVRDLLTRYAQHTNPNVGMGGGDPYASPDYQPR